jgi:hypothetical protein
LEESNETTSFGYRSSYFGASSPQGRGFERQRVLPTVEEASTRGGMEETTPKDFGLHHAQRVKVPSGSTQHNSKPRRFVGLWSITNKQQNLVLAVKVFRKGVFADSKDSQNVRRPAKPHREFGGGFGCLRSCGQ